MAFVISPSVVVNNLSVPLTHARIGYDNFVPGATVTGTTAEAAFPADAIKRQTTWERWKPTGTTNEDLLITPATSQDANYIGIAAHTLGSSGATVALAYSVDNVTFTTIETLSPADNSAIMILFTSVSAGYWRIRITSATSAPNIGVVYIGKTLDMDRPIYGGHSPINLSRQTVVRPTESEKGQWLGRSVIRYGLQTSYDWENLAAAWYRANFDPFVKAARFRPFFIAWRPETFPQEVAFGWTSNDIQPKNSGTRDLMSVSVSMSAYADE